MAGILRNWRRKWRRKVEFTGRMREQARALLLDVVDVIAAADVDYVLDYGTLLGILRDGDLIPWDSDIDLAIPAGELPKLLAVLKTFRKRGRWISRRPFTHAYHYWTEADCRAIKIRSRRWFFFKGPLACDICVKYPAPDGCRYWSSMRMVCKADRRFFEGRETVEYHGRRLNVPAHAAEYLATIYGDWRTPNPAYNPTREDGTIVGSLAQLGWHADGAKPAPRA